MNVPVNEAVVLVFAMGAVIFFCRVFPFIFLRKNQENGRMEALLDFAERIAPPAAMTVLAFNALGPHLGVLAKSIFLVNAPEELFPALAALMAAGLTAAVHVWKRNALVSIFGGTAVYMILLNLF